MNYNIIKAAVCAILCCAIIACEKDVKPEPINPDELRVLTIAELKDFNEGELTAKVTIPAVVMSKSEVLGTTMFTIQDGYESRDGILINHKSTHSYQAGDNILIDIDGCQLSKDDSFCTITIPNDKSVTKSNSTTAPYGAVIIDNTRLQSGNFQSMYVGLSGYEVIEEQISESVGKTLKFINKDSDTIRVITPSTASFAGEIVPELSGTIKGIALYQDGEYVIVPQNISDFAQLTEKRFRVQGDNQAILVWSGGPSLDSFVSEASTNEVEGAVSLDADGTQPANCFVIDKPGIYSFYAKNPLGEYPAGIPEETQIYIHVQEVGGNTVVGYVDPASKKILWTWHIWTSTVSLEDMSLTRNTTATDNNQTVTRSIVMLDRLLGAVNTTPGTAGPHGLYYQWGRKDPIIGVGIIGQFSSTEDESETEIGGAATASSSINKTYVEDWYFDDGDEETKTHQGASAYPTRYISNNDNAPSVEDITWAAVANPCPYGYHIPNSDESKAIWGVNASLNYGGMELVYHADGTTEGMDTETHLGFVLKGLDVWFPNNGNRARKAGRMLNLGRQHHYWCDYLNASGASGYAARIRDNQINPGAAINRGNACSIRCVKDYKEE